MLLPHDGRGGGFSPVGFKNSAQESFKAVVVAKGNRVRRSGALGYIVGIFHGRPIPFSGIKFG
ncbi:hypothetical protein SDC9_193245 [bioreactor metagenome]|uniref:Uncharacterized protein n=1 Tax=bioreactor metagenome TaxID=1076179 RepID=A0A645I483_9ZZZZ